MKDLLIISCSKTKTDAPGLVPALYRYDGPNYRIIRKVDLSNIDILILSAKYGLIESSTPIENYEQRMTPDRAWALRESVEAKLKEVLTQNQYREIAVVLGADYMPAINQNLILNAKILTGGLGDKLHKLSVWLAEHSTTPVTENKEQLTMF